jgi:hypothetical protein
LRSFSSQRVAKPGIEPGNKPIQKRGRTNMPAQVACGNGGRDARVRLKTGLVRPKPSAGNSPSPHEPQLMKRFGRRPGPAPRMYQEPSTPHLVWQPQSATASCGFHSSARTAVIHLQPTRKDLPHLKTHCKPNSYKKSDDFRSCVSITRLPSAAGPSKLSTAKSSSGVCRSALISISSSALTWY